MQAEWEWLCATKHLFCLQHSSFVCPLKGKPAICCKWDKSMWSLLASGSRKTKLWSGTKLCFFIHFKSRKIFATNCYTKMVFFFFFFKTSIWVQLLRDGYGILLHLPQTCSRYDAFVVKQINNNNWTLSHNQKWGTYWIWLLFYEKTFRFILVFAHKRAKQHSDAVISILTSTKRFTTN